ncbi:MAG: hypothetical protein M3N50_14850 [Pseudomonadota bacterium]|nr:hypothetical protein [Pseudomonadota bacterium]
MAAKWFLRVLTCAFAGKCATRWNLESAMEQCREAVMQDAFVGSWAQESHLSPQVLASLHDLNHRFLDLTVSAGRSGLAGQVARLSAVQREAAAHCPYALFDLRFEDQGHWQMRLLNPSHLRVADESIVDGDTVGFVRLALFFAWHTASSAGLAAQLLLGMNGTTAAAFRRLTLNDLPALVVTEAANLTARWSTCEAYWSALMGAASQTDPSALRRVQLYGLQLAAAARLPTPLGGMWNDLR